ncbi:MAG: hypothetical protein JO013_11795 [Alphaproteobacteria bacterium]|nr:hypothetical protein [Alphaproteobacteria bacterium]
MKTSRLTLLITEREKERIGRKAASLGISASEFVRRAADLLDPDDIAALGDMESLLPEFEAALARMQDNLTAAIAHSERHAQDLARLASPAYREAVRREVAADPAGVAATAALLGCDREQRGPVLARAAEAREPWGENVTAVPKGADE